VDENSITGSVRFVKPTVFVPDTSFYETHSSRVAVTVRLDGPSPVPVTVRYSTRNGTAVAGSDYEAASGTVTFAPGEMSNTGPGKFLP
jgi:hypothetical protein